MEQNEEVLQEEQNPVMVHFHEVSGRSVYPFLSPIVTRFIIICKMNDINYKILGEATCNTPIVEIDEEYLTDPELIEKKFNQHFGIPLPSANEQQLFVAISNVTKNNRFLSPFHCFDTDISKSDKEVCAILTTKKKIFKLLSDFFLGKISRIHLRTGSKRMKKLKFNVLFHHDLIEIEKLITRNPEKYLAGKHITSADAVLFSQLKNIKTIAENPKISKILSNDYAPIMNYIKTVETAFF